jgi:leucyl aminopeptidase
MIGKLSNESLYNFLLKFTSFHNRYYKSESGTKSSEWLFETVKELASGSDKVISVSQFKHAWPQSTVIARFEPDASIKTDDEIVIVGAHQDSINQRDPMHGRAPGAGTSTTCVVFTFVNFVFSSS